MSRSARLADRLDEHARALAHLAERLDIVETRSRKRGDTDTASAVEFVRLELRGQADTAADMSDEARGMDPGYQLPDD